MSLASRLLLANPGAQVSTALTGALTTPSAKNAFILGAGYFAGGEDGTVNLSRIDKITFPGDTKSTLSATLTSGRNSPSGAANSGTAAYIAGGFDGALTSGIDKIAFLADTKSTLSATLSTARYAGAAMANSGTAAYFGGGYDSAAISGIDKIAFSADTKTTLSATLTSARYGLTGMANSGTAGYFAGGAALDGIDKIAFSADTKTTLAEVLSAVRGYPGGAANSGTAGYIAGGSNSSFPNGLSSINKIAFSADTITTLSATLTEARQRLGGAAHSGAAAYFPGGSSLSGAGYTSAIDKIAFSADTKSTLTATLTTVNRTPASAANSGAL